MKDTLGYYDSNAEAFVESTASAWMEDDRERLSQLKSVAGSGRINVSVVAAQAIAS